MQSQNNTNLPKIDEESSDVLYSIIGGIFFIFLLSATINFCVKKYKIAIKPDSNNSII